MSKSKDEVHNMTNEQFDKFQEAIKIIAEKCKSKTEFLRDMDRIQSQGKKKPQQ